LAKFFAQLCPISTRPVHFNEVLLLLVELQKSVGLHFDMPDLYMTPGLSVEDNLTVIVLIKPIAYVTLMQSHI
jgi:hypothetical protein